VSSHTPGPWAAIDYGYKTVGVFAGMERVLDANTRYGRTREEVLANARLAAAAPELLAALRAYVRSGVIIAETGDAVAALAKATGGAQ
jgi:hypothetical protein